MFVTDEADYEVIQATFEKQGKRYVPTSVRYRLDDRTCGTQTVIDWTVVQPALVVEITIPSSANRILNTCNAYEVRILTVQADYGTENQRSKELEYRVRNLRGIP